MSTDRHPISTVHDKTVLDGLLEWLLMENYDRLATAGVLMMRRLSSQEYAASCLRFISFFPFSLSVALVLFLARSLALFLSLSCIVLHFFYLLYAPGSPTC